MEQKNIKPLPPRPVPPKAPPKPVQGNNNAVKEETIISTNESAGIFNDNIKEEQVVNKELKNQGKQKKEDKKVKKSEVSKKPKNKRKKIIFALCAVATLAVIGAVVGIVLVNNQNNQKLETPNLEVAQLYNRTILKTTEISGAVSYEFEVTSKSGSKTSLTSTSNVIELSSYLNQAGEFSVRVRAFGKGSGATSDFSNIVDIVNYVQLKAPKIFVNNLISSNEVYKTNDNLADDILVWNDVPNAEYYLVRYGADKTEKIQSGNGSSTFNLNTIYKYGAGVYQISVIAVPSEDSYYTNSEPEKVITIEYYDKQSKVTNLDYNSETKNLTFEILIDSNYGNEFDLYITQVGAQATEYKVYLNECETVEEDGILKVTANLSHIVKGDLQEISIITLGDGVYSQNSEPAQLTISTN